MAINNHVVVCGDSFCTAVHEPQTHFSQILRDRYGYNVTNLARSSMSTVGICLQIQSAIDLRPRAIIYARTGPARLDIPLGGKFVSHLGLKNFAYPYPHEVSHGHDCVGGSDANIFSHNISTLADLTDDSVNPWLPRPLDIELRQAVKMYVAYLYDEQLKATTESWMYAHWHQQIQNNGILAIPFAPDTFASIAYDFARRNPRWDRSYHTDDETQIELAARLHDILQHQG